jgi:hypothetical protein
MIIKLKKIYDLAQEYHIKNQDDAWEKLFDYLNCVGFENCYSNEQELLRCFSKYMHGYRMYRNTKLNKEKLSNILKEGKKEYLEFLCNHSNETFVKAWIKSNYLLRKFQVSPSPVMITKILMGFGGRTPAYDSKFLDALGSNPTFLLYGIRHLVELLKKSGFKELKTHGGKNIIPWERVLDMALWLWSANKSREPLIKL